MALIGARGGDLLDILGVHQYHTQVTERWPADVPDFKPGWQTEMSDVKWRPEQGPSTGINNGVAVAGWIDDTIVNGQASAWFWWWHTAYFTGDNEGLFLKNGTDTKRHCTLGNFSSFVRPGYTRVDVAEQGPADVLLSAYQGESSTVVVVAINTSNAPIEVTIAIAGGAEPASMTPHLTSASANLAAQSPVTESNATFTVSLPDPSVTTFFGS